jgi:predicted DNA-binding protein YlxM (UPF0122 family)
MEIANRPYGKIFKGHTVPYGTLVGASDELKKVYYTHGYLRDEDLPDTPCLPYEDVECHSPEEEMFKKDMVRVVEEVLNGITPREKTVLCMRFGIGLKQDYSLEEIGNRFDVTRERIRQIEAKALRKMKHPSRLDVFKELLGWYESTADKEAEAKKLREQWSKARERARERDEAKKQAVLNALLRREQKEREYKQELERVQQEDFRLRAKWEEIKPMVSDTEWIEHIKTANPEMYQELKYLVGDIWGYNADKVWEMYAEKK